MKENPGKFRRLGTMLDCSRNGVMTVGSVKRWIDLSAMMGNNMLMLYTEDTYEMEGQPYFGYGRGRYTKEELKEIDAYGQSKGVEVMACIQTLAHLNGITRWPAYQPLIDTDDILLAGDERVYELIESMFRTISECFTSRVVNIGMDEAHMIGRGRYYDLHGDADRSEILLDHITRVAQIGKRYGLTMCMWSDMFYRLVVGDYYDSNAPIREDIRSRIPENVELIYWDYYSTDPQRYRDMMESHAKMKPGFWFAGGLWTWAGFTPHNLYSQRASKAALPACVEAGVQDVFLTLWGDNGGETSKFSILPSWFYASELAKGNTDEQQIREKFSQQFGIVWDDFMLLDLPGSPNSWAGEDTVINAEKYLLYNDPFQGLLDSTLRGDEGASYEECGEKLLPLCGHPEWGYLFETQRMLCRVLAIKANLGQRTRAAYTAGGAEALSAVIKEYKTLEERLEDFYGAFSRQWYRENKGQGFEVQDIRLGGLMRRVKHCREMLENYQQGTLERIPELEETLLDLTGKGTDFQKQPVYVNHWQAIATANIL